MDGTAISHVLPDADDRPRALCTTPRYGDCATAAHTRVAGALRRQPSCAVHGHVRQRHQREVSCSTPARRRVTATMLTACAIWWIRREDSRGGRCIHEGRRARRGAGGSIRRCAMPKQPFRHFRLTPRATTPETGDTLRDNTEAGAKSRLPFLIIVTAASRVVTTAALRTSFFRIHFLPCDPQAAVGVPDRLQNRAAPAQVINHIIHVPITCTCA